MKRNPQDLSSTKPTLFFSATQIPEQKSFTAEKINNLTLELIYAIGHALTYIWAKFQCN